MLLPIPAYSHELNPMEQVWKYFRDSEFAFQLWDGYGEIERGHGCLEQVREQPRSDSINHRPCLDNG